MILFNAEYFEEQAKGLGINSDTHVIVYSGDGTNGFYFGGRGWWMFYVCNYNYQKKESKIDNNVV